MAKIAIEPKKIVSDYLKTIQPFIRVKEAILFGSWARGDSHPDSDIDLIVISPDFKKMDFMDRLVFLSRMRGRKFMSPAMDIFGYTSREFDKLSKESVVLSEAKEQGKTIYKAK